MEQDILEQIYFGRIVPWENRNDKTPEMEQCSEQVYQDVERLTQLLDEDGKIDPDKLRPITFDPIHNAYRELGEKVGNAFRDGAKLK